MVRRVGVASSALAVVVGTADAGYIAHVEGAAGEGHLQVLAGDSFGVRVRLEAAASAQTLDSAIFRLLFSLPGLEVQESWLEWSSPFITGGVDDLSSPGPSVAGIIDGSVYTDPFDPAAVDLYFENLTPSRDTPFEEGVLLSLILRIPSGTPAGTLFEVAAEPDTFTNGSEVLDVQAGNALEIEVIIPHPASATLLLAAGFRAITRRRR